MNGLGKISIILAGALLMLHTFLPHQHHTEMRVEEHVIQHASADSLLDFIKLAFHLDQGNGHLENFQVPDGFQPGISAAFTAVYNFNFESTFIYAPKATYHLVQDNPLERYHISKLRFRGPPAKG